jgi:hypothetical protein
MKLLYLFSLLMLNFRPGNTIQGVVVGKDNNLPISHAYLFVVKGEEETITGSNGRFAITTWQKFPVSLSVEHPDYKKIKIVIRESDTKQVIKLEQK